MRRLSCLVLLGVAVVSCGYAQQKPPSANGTPKEVVLDRVSLTQLGFALTLRAIEGDGRIEMIVGFLEGQSISMAQRKEKAARPMTHDLLKNFLDRNGWKVDRVVVRDLIDGTFLADLVIAKDGQKQTYDARPSDSIALALRAGAKIFVVDKVFEQQRKQDEEPAGEPRRRNRTIT